MMTDGILVGTGNRDVALEYFTDWSAAALIAQVLVEIEGDLNNISDHCLRTPDGQILAPRDPLDALDADYVTLLFPEDCER